MPRAAVELFKALQPNTVAGSVLVEHTVRRSVYAGYEVR